MIRGKGLHKKFRDAFKLKDFGKQVHLIVGLGNPGRRYRHTRHNIGFMIVDMLAGRWKKKFKRGKGNYRFCRIIDQSGEFLLVKPTTFMNRSGIAVQDLLKQYPVMLPQILVICDDLNLPVGKIRLRGKGSDGGQKGLASIISQMDSEAFPRLRIGIGSSREFNAAEFVLSPFVSEEKEIIGKMIAHGSQAVLDFIQHGLSWTMNHYNS